MRVKITRSFTGYPKGEPVDFAQDAVVTLTADYVEESQMVKKGLAVPVEESPTEI
jgi:hypothetical protein